jgi:hypothetical protein
VFAPYAISRARHAEIATRLREKRAREEETPEWPS